LVQHVHIEDFAGRLTEKAKVSGWFVRYLNLLCL
jgi:hypothetical protein